MRLLRPQEIYVRVLTLGLVNVTLFGERVFAGVIKGSRDEIILDYLDRP